MRRLSISWDAVLIASVVLMAGICAQAQQSVLAEEAELKGRIVQISPEEEREDVMDFSNEPKTRVIQEESYWIGIRGRSIESEVLRTHLQLAQNMGVVIEDVLPESPADKAGLQKHDIILRSNGNAVHDMTVMQQQVREGGEQPIELKIVRYGKNEKVVVIPELRPEKFRAAEQRGFNQFHPGQDFDQMRGLLDQFQGRQIGPGIVLRGQRFDMGQIPNGVSVQVQRQNDGPAKIKIQQGEQTWEIEGDDQKAIEELPDDVRPFVENMLGQRNHGFGNFRRDGFELGDDGLLSRKMAEMLMGNAPDDLRAAEQRAQEAEDEISRRIRDLERQLQDLQERVRGEERGARIEE